MSIEQSSASTMESKPTRVSMAPSAAAASLEPQHAGYLPNLRYDIPASVVVFLVALPLCLGIAVASGAPPLAGLISGIVGGVVVAWASGSHVAVSGPAAGLTVIILNAIQQLGFEGFLLATCVAGLMQIGLGVLRTGIFAYYFPSTVIKGMLAAIGLILIIKQIPHALGFDADFEGDEVLFQAGQAGPVEQISYALSHVHPGAAIMAAAGLLILVVMGAVPALRKIRWLPPPLVVVLVGVGLNALFAATAPGFVTSGDHLVRLPEGGLTGFLSALKAPDFARWTDPAVYKVAFTLAIVASLETLLCVEAMDKLDPYKRSTPTNRELVAQGFGNALAGLLGGLPMTAVIVRGSANIQSGGRTRVSAFMHGVLLLIAVVMLPWAINLVPLAALAAILLHVGYKLAPYELLKRMVVAAALTFLVPAVSKLAGRIPSLRPLATRLESSDHLPAEQWLPFAVTVVAILVTDLLKGVGIGMTVGILFILRAHMRAPYYIHHLEAREEDGKKRIRIELGENVSFLNKASMNQLLHGMPDRSIVEIDGRAVRYMHSDVAELIQEFADTAHTRGIEVELVEIPSVQPLGGH